MESQLGGQILDEQLPRLQMQSLCCTLDGAQGGCMFPVQQITKVAQRHPDPLSELRLGELNPARVTSLESI